MAQTELQVIVKAKQLANHTLKLTSNCNKYPKKFRFSLVDKMQNKCLNIYETLMEANRTGLRLYGHERSELQTRVITYCDELLFYIELSYELNIISMGSVEHWSKMVTDIKHMTIAWRSKDKSRN